MDKYTLKVIDEKYCLVYEYIDGDRNCRKSTNSVDVINSSIDFLGFEKTVAKEEIKNGDDKTLIFDDFTIKLRDYEKNKDMELYKKINFSVGYSTKKRDLVAERFVNKKRIKRTIGAGLIFGTIAGSILLGKKLNSKPQPIISVENPIDNSSDIEKPQMEIEVTAPEIPETPQVENPVVSTGETEKTAESTAGFPELNPEVDEPTNLDCYSRFSMSKLRYKCLAANNMKMPLATNMTDYTVDVINKTFITTTWDYMEQYGEEFAVDPYLLLAMGMKESSLSHEDTIPSGVRYNGHGVGIMQHEDPQNERIISAYNFKDDKEEFEKMSLQSACDLEKNIKMAAMILQERIKKYNNNIYITLQSYNYGSGMMDMIINLYAKDKNCTPEDVINNISDTGWLKYVEDVHNNPQNYLSNWNYPTYGDPNYVKGVLGNYVGEHSVNLGVRTNLITLETKDLNNTLTR